MDDTDGQLAVDGTIPEESQPEGYWEWVWISDEELWGDAGGGDAGPSPEQGSNWGTRALGALQVVGGLAQLGLAVGFASATGGAGAIVSFGVAANGLDDVYTGLRTAFSGQRQESVISSGVARGLTRTGWVSAQTARGIGKWTKTGFAAASMGASFGNIIHVARAGQGAAGGFARTGADLPGNNFLSNAAQMKPEPGYFDLAVHSFNGGTQFLGSVAGRTPIGMSLVEVEKALLSNGWRAGQPIRLISCNAGSPAAGAQAIGNQLSQYLRVPVMAPKADITVFAKGEWIIRAGLAAFGQQSIKNPWAIFG